MIDVGLKDSIYACDECPIVCDLERRLALTDIYPEWGGFQYDYCACEKVEGKFVICGYCEDAWVNKPNRKKRGKRKTGRAYRRKMERRELRKAKELKEYSHFSVGLGYDKAGIEHLNWWKRCEPEPEYRYTYVKRRKESSSSRFWKNQSNRFLRRNKLDLPKGNQYKKHFDFFYKYY